MVVLLVSCLQILTRSDVRSNDYDTQDVVQDKEVFCPLKDLLALVSLEFSLDGCVMDMQSE